MGPQSDHVCWGGSPVGGSLPSVAWAPDRAAAATAAAGFLAWPLCPSCVLLILVFLHLCFTPVSTVPSIVRRKGNGAKTCVHSRPRSGFCWRWAHPRNLSVCDRATLLPPAAVQEAHRSNSPCAKSPQQWAGYANPSPRLVFPSAMAEVWTPLGSGRARARHRVKGLAAFLCSSMVCRAVVVKIKRIRM